MTFFMPAPIAMNSVDTFVSEQHQDVSFKKKMILHAKWLTFIQKKGICHSENAGQGNH